MGSVSLGNRNGIRNLATLSRFPTLLPPSCPPSPKFPFPSVSDVELDTCLRLAACGPPSQCSLGVGGGVGAQEASGTLRNKVVGHLRSSGED